MQICRIRQKVFRHKANTQAVRLQRLFQRMEPGRFKAAVSRAVRQIGMHGFPQLGAYRGHDIAAVGNQITVKGQLQIPAGVFIFPRDHHPRLRRKKILRPAAKING